MTLLPIKDHRTAAYGPDLEGKIAATHKGMAHFAGTGPAGMTCRRCAFWNNKKAATASDLVELDAATCAKFKALMSRNGEKIPAHALACRYFEGRSS